jgi:Tfp pilus assembly protein PilF
MTLAIALFLTALAQKPAPKPAAAPATEPDPMAEAMKDLDSGHAAEAIVILKGLAEKDPDNYGVWFNLGIAYATANDDAKATESFRKVLSIEPKLYEGQLNLGHVLLKQKQYAEAETFLAQAAEQKPAEVRPRFLLGMAYLRDGKPAEAETSLRAAIALDDKLADAYQLLARSFSAREKWPEAAEAMGHYLTLAPNDTAGQLELAHFLEKAKKDTEAAAIYARFPKDPAAMEHAGMIEFGLGNYKQAAEYFAVSVALSPTTASRYALANAYLRGGELEKAGDAASEIVTREPGNYDMRMFYGRIMRDQKKYPAAERQFLEATKLKPSALEAWNELSAMEILTENYPAALESLDKSRQLGGETAAYFWFRAIVFDTLMQKKEALQNYKRFLELSNGKSPDEEFKARQRVRILTRVVNP